ncbi:MAG TPA: glycosyltransferase family 4 protein [Acidobacteriota bacterium]|jgi:glycosyltransferase involved in cell wall biosynthesis
MNLPERLNILHVHTLPIISGSGINTLLTMIGSLERGHDVTLACAPGGRLVEKARQAGVRVEPIAELGNEINPVRDLAAVRSLSRLMKRGKYHLVHTHNSKAGFIGRLAARRSGVPVVIHTVHGFAFHDAESKMRRFLFRTLERMADRWCDGMIFISRPLKQWAQKEGIGRNLPQAVIYSGIDVNAFQAANGSAFRKAFGISDQQLVAGIVSKLWEGKGHDILLHAWREVLNTVRNHSPLLLVVGEGNLEPSLKGLAERLGLGHSVIFTGFQEDVPSATAALDVSVLPSLFEGMGRVVLEAFAAGKPMVASKVGGIPDLLKHGENGFLVEPGNRASLVTALREILANSAVRERLASGARNSLRPEHSSRYMVEQIHRFYREVAQAKSVSSV